jgi:hypothetical protein
MSRVKNPHVDVGIQAMKAQAVSSSTLSLTSALEEWVVNPTPRPPYFRDRDRVPMVQKAGWAPVSVWTGAGNLAPTGMRSPDPPVSIMSLYRLRYIQDGSNMTGTDCV